MDEVQRAGAPEVLRREEEKVEGRSAVFLRELGLGEFVRFVVACNLWVFAIPLFGAVRVGLRALLRPKVASASGLLVLLPGIALTIAPIVDVVSPYAFAAKLIAVTLAFNFAGAALYRAGRRSQQRVAPVEPEPWGGR